MRLDDDTISRRRQRWQQRTAWLLEHRDAVLSWALVVVSGSLVVFTGFAIMAFLWTVVAGVVGTLVAWW